MCANGNMLIGDNDNNRVRMVNTNGIISTFAGNGTAGYTGDGGQATDAELSIPEGVAFDAAGNTYITEYGGERIRKVNTLGIITTIAGNGNGGFSGDGGQATDAGIDGPWSITLDPAGNLYIADYWNGRVRKVNSAGIISTIAGGGSSYGEGGQATDADISSPYGLAFDVMGNLYVADQGSGSIRKINTTGIITTAAGGGISGLGDGGVATAAELHGPIGVAFDPVGNLYIGDQANQRIRMINTLGIITTIAGNGTAGFSGDGGLATNAEIVGPAGICFDAAGNLYIADAGNERIRKVTMCYTPTASYTLTNTAPHYWTASPTYSAYTDSARWYWGDGTDTLALYPSHTYSVAGRYNICVTAYSSCGDSVQYCQNDTVYRTTNSQMVYINVDSSSTHTTGIKQLAGSNNQVSIYPNPNKGLFVIETNATSKQTVQVYDVNGKMVFSQTIQPSLRQAQGAQTITIDASTLNEGVYNISLISNEGVVNKRLVIVR